jgi:hypothetical protein
MLYRRAMKDPIFKADEPYDALSTQQLRQLLNKGTKPERARAMGAFARRASMDATLRDEALAAISDQTNRTLRVMGAISIAHIGVACLFYLGSADLPAQLCALIAQWPEPDRGDLLWFLRSQGIDLAMAAN